MKKQKTYKIPTFNYSRKQYGCYIYFGAYDHQKEAFFKDKIRDISQYSKFRSFEEIRIHFGDRKLQIVEYVKEHIIPKISEAVVAGHLDRGIDTKHWTALLKRRQSPEFIPIEKLLDEYVQTRYMSNDSPSNKDLYRDALKAFKQSLEVILGKETYNRTTITDITQSLCKQVFKNWEDFVFDNNNTMRTYRSKVRVFFEAFIDTIKTNPVGPETKIKASPKSRNIPLHKEDFTKIFSHLKKSNRRKYKELLGFCLLMYTGLLRGDTIYQLRCCHFKKEPDGSYLLEIATDMVKNDESGLVAIPKEVVDYLFVNDIYDPNKPDKLLFPPVLKKRPSRETSRNEQRKIGYLRNRMWASNLWNDILRNELNYSKHFTSQHNVYCLKATGALFLLTTEKWDIREIQAQMLHINLSTTCTYIEKLSKHNVKLGSRKFTNSILEMNSESTVNAESPVRMLYTSSEVNDEEIDLSKVLSKNSKRTLNRIEV